MLLRKLVVLCVTLVAIPPCFSQVMKKENDHFIVRLGPVQLGSVVIKTSCNDKICSYDALIKGSFMFIKANIKEKGTYRQTNYQVLPVSTHYDEKIGSKKRKFTYDFESMKINDRRKKKIITMPEGVYPFMPLLNQVRFDLKNKGPKKHYKFLSKHKVKQATITNYTKTVTSEGILHHFTGTEDEDELEFYFLQNGTEIKLQKITYGGFHLSRTP